MNTPPSAPDARTLILYPNAIAMGEDNANPCPRCSSPDWVDVEISDNRVRRDCRGCDRFVRWSRWYGEVGAEVAPVAMEGLW